MTSKVILLAFVLASIVALSAAIQCFESNFGGNNQPTSDDYTKANCSSASNYCLKWTSKDFKYIGKGCEFELKKNILAETGGDPTNGAVPDCSKTQQNSYSIKNNGKVVHEGSVYCCKKDLCNGAAYGAPTLATALLGVMAAMWMRA